MTLADARTLFPHTAHGVYLDHASTGPLSQRVLDAVAAHYAERGGTNPNNYATVLPLFDRCRARLAHLLGAEVRQVEFAPNTSYALNVLAQGYPWQPGDRVAVPRCEFPANVYPFLGLAARGVAVDFIPTRNGTFTLDDVAQTLTPQTRLVSVSWVQFLSGFRVDLRALADLAHAHGALLCVDAIQGLGALRLDAPAAGIDFLACGGQKWLMGEQGTAFFYVTDALRDRLTPLRGWLNGPVDWDDFSRLSLDWHPDATCFRVGTLNTTGLVALDAALQLYFDVGLDVAETQVLRLAQRLRDGLTAQGFVRYGSADAAHAAGIVTFDAPDPAGLHAHLLAHRVACSLRDRRLRLAPSWVTTDAEVDAALERIAAFGR